MTPEQLSSEIAGGKLRSAYLLVGSEPLLRDEALAVIEAAVLVDGSDDFNLDRLDGATASPVRLRECVGVLPMLSPRRLVVLRDPAGGHDKSLTDALPEVVPELAGQERVVLVVTAEKADKRARWFKAFAEPAATVDCNASSKASEQVAFVRAEAKRQGLSFEKGVAELLVERIGPQLLLLRQEIAKLALVAGGEKIQLGHAEVSTGQVAETTVWELTDAIGQGRRADALALLSRMLLAGEAPPRVLGGLAFHFRNLLRAASGGRVRGSRFAAGKTENQARRYTEARLTACLSAIHDADLQIKGATKLEPAIVLERLVIGLAS